MSNERGFARPEFLVSTQWVAEHLDDPEVYIIASNEDPLVYPSGHLPGAVEIDWVRDLNQPLKRDFLDAEAFQELLQRKGINPGMTLVFYGDKNNWWAAYALYIFSLFKVPNLRMMEGGRLKWIREDRPVTTTVPQLPRGEMMVTERFDELFRARREQVMHHLEQDLPIIDVRSDQEFTGEALHMPGYLSDGALRSGRIPGAIHLHWEECVTGEFAEFKSREEIENIYRERGFQFDTDAILYCRIGKRSSHNWFVMTHLLGYERVKNYDSGWLEWGNLHDVPIER
jgi:thiosulfate/3-mercaptopyruvate sulfurtransferase